MCPLDGQPESIKASGHSCRGFKETLRKRAVAYAAGNFWNTSLEAFLQSYEWRSPETKRSNSSYDNKKTWQTKTVATLWNWWSSLSEIMTSESESWDTHTPGCVNNANNNRKVQLGHWGLFWAGFLKPYKLLERILIQESLLKPPLFMKQCYPQ